MNDAPVLKIGAVVVRGNGDVLIMQPIPKHVGEIPPYVLPRGSRQYRDANGEWHDARDAATGKQHAAMLEDFYRGLAREIEEEAGVSPTQLAASRVVEMGAMDFQSRTKGVYPIHWFAVVVTDHVAETIVATKPGGCAFNTLGKLGRNQGNGGGGNFSAGYVAVIEAALSRVRG